MDVGMLLVVVVGVVITGAIAIGSGGSHLFPGYLISASISLSLVQDGDGGKTQVWCHLSFLYCSS